MVPLVNGFVLDLAGTGPFPIERDTWIEGDGNGICELCLEFRDDPDGWVSVTGYREDGRAEEFIVCQKCCPEE